MTLACQSSQRRPERSAAALTWGKFKRQVWGVSLRYQQLTRLRAVGLTEDHSCNLPITQSEFADAMGVTTVHVNRLLQQMRAEGLVELKGDRLNIPDWETLKRVGDFDPTYLHLRKEQAAA